MDLGFLRKEKFYLLEDIEYRIFALCDVLAQMYNKLLNIENNIGKINHSFFFSKKEVSVKIVSTYKNLELQKFLSEEILEIVEYFSNDKNYKYIAEKKEFIYT